MYGERRIKPPPDQPGWDTPWKWRGVDQLQLFSVSSTQVMPRAKNASENSTSDRKVLPKRIVLFEQTLMRRGSTMRFTIHDVGHGFCAELRHDNGNVMLWDCGHKSAPENRPSRFLPASGVRTVHRMFVTNFDEDHISDLPDLRCAVHINLLHRNLSITPAQLRCIKEESGPISPAMGPIPVRSATPVAVVTGFPAA